MCLRHPEEVLKWPALRHSFPFSVMSNGACRFFPLSSYYPHLDQSKSDSEQIKMPRRRTKVKSLRVLKALASTKTPNQQHHFIVNVLKNFLLHHSFSKTGNKLLNVLLDELLHAQVGKHFSKNSLLWKVLVQPTLHHGLHFLVKRLFGFLHNLSSDTRAGKACQAQVQEMQMWLDTASSE